MPHRSLGRGKIDVTTPPRGMHRDEAIRQLMRDERWPAVEQLLTDARNDFIEASSQQGFAHHHGALAHAAGSIYAIGTLLAEFHRIRTEAPKAKKAAPTE